VDRIGGLVLGGGRLRVQPGAERVEEVAQVLSRVALERGQDLVELDRRRRAGDLSVSPLPSWGEPGSRP
jgi:hypothetical protein